ncbi:hypothetical protein D3C79_906490 [compost metagenome]
MAPGIFPSAIPPQEGCLFVSPRNIGPGKRRRREVHRTRDGGICRPLRAGMSPKAVRPGNSKGSTVGGKRWRQPRAFDSGTCCQATVDGSVLCGWVLLR